ncbi:unnamed protein product [Gadus morhua 'NCC']
MDGTPPLQCPLRRDGVRTVLTLVVDGGQDGPDLRAIPHSLSGPQPPPRGLKQLLRSDPTRRPNHRRWKRSRCPSNGSPRRSSRACLRSLQAIQVVKHNTLLRVVGSQIQHGLLRLPIMPMPGSPGFG